ncbi:MAG: hypothetical protein WAV00_08380 [Nocardioides sp.]
MHAVVVPSPLLGVAVYSPFGRALNSRGYVVSIADPELPSGAADAEDGGVGALLDSLVAQCAGADLIVPHSNAGRFAPAIAEQVGAAIVYVDALLPGIGDSAGFADFIQGKVADDGLLPGWTEWWPAEDLLDVVPEEWLSLLEQTQPRLDPAFLLHDPPTPPTWYLQPAAYLALGDGYRAEADAARALGWPVGELAAGHLHLVVDPEQVAAEVHLLASGILTARS